MSNPAENQENLQQEPGIIYAGFKRRMNAAMIDMVVFVVAIFLVFGSQSIISPEVSSRMGSAYQNATTGGEENAEGEVVTRTIEAEEMRETMAIILPIMIKNSIYQLILIGFIVIPCWYYKGATLGKKIYSMKIVDAETLARPTLRQCFFRFFAYIASFVVLFLGFLAIGRDAEKRGWHDKIAGTMVIHTKDLDSQSEKDKKFKRDTILVLIFVTVFIIYSLVKKG